MNLRNPFAHAGIRSYLLVLLVLTLLPAFAVFAYATATQHARELRQSERELGTWVASANREQARLFDATARALSALAEEPAIVNFQQPHCDRLLARLRQLHPEFANLAAADARGDIRCSALPLARPVNVAHRKFFAAATTRKLAIGAAQIGAITGKAQNNLAWPLYALDAGARTERIGVVFAAVDLSWLDRLAEDLRLPRDTVLLALDRKGAVLARWPASAQWIGRAVPEATRVHALLAQGGGIVRDRAGVERQFVLAPLSRDRDTVLALGVPTAAIYAHGERFYRYSLIALVLGFFAALALAWSSSRRFIAAPLAALVAAVQRIEAGNGGTPATGSAAVARGPRELRVLAATFARTAHTLGEREAALRQEIAQRQRVEAEVRALNAELERRVEQRTQALARASDERARVALALRDSERQLRAILDAEPECVKVIDAEGKLLQINAAGLALLEAESADGLLGRSVLHFIVPEHRDAFCALSETVLDGHRASLEFEIVGLSGARRWLDTRALPLTDPGTGAAAVLVIARDVSEQRRQRAHIDRLAHYDALTGLPNRNLALDRLQQATVEAERRARHVALLLLDIDGFKLINDSLGHTLGDEVLRALAHRLQETVREGDTVARLSGDEFALILNDLAAPADAALVANKLFIALNRPFPLNGHEIFVGVSVGIAVFPDDSRNAEELLRNADVAVYRAKDAGRNAYQFYVPEMTRKASERLGMESALRQALLRDEFELHYQPLLDGAGAEVRAFEALVRWRHPQLGLLAPGRFIPLAEETGLIAPLTVWVLRHACAQARAWQLAGYRDIRMCVNVSAQTFAQQDVIASVRAALQESELAADALELELTESLLLQPDSRAALAALSALGVRLSIDDFGTGYSSLAYLKRFPIDTLKIDRSFVHDLARADDDRAIVRAIITMAHTLGLRVIAEGVETAAQLEFLRAQGCDLVQGFYFAAPQPAAAAAAFLAQRRGSAETSRTLHLT